jgi:hypothetical protein
MDKPNNPASPPAQAPNRNEPSTFSNRARDMLQWIVDSLFPFMKQTNNYSEYATLVAQAAQQAVLDNTNSVASASNP